MNYDDFLNLKIEPFNNVPDTRFFYESNAHQRALFKLMYAAEKMKGLAVLYGEIGTGKTTVSRKFLSNLNNSGKFKTGLLILTHEDFSPDWLIDRIGSLLGLRNMPEKKSDKMSLITKRLMQFYKAGKKTVIIIDEINKMKDAQTIEELRGFLNLELGAERLVTFVLVGTPDAEEYLSANESLNQRIALKIFLPPMDLVSVGNYIEHRLKIAGASKQMFTPDSYKRIYQYSGGRPRLINAICDNALLESAFLRKLPVDGMMIDEVAMSLGLKKKISDQELSNTFGNNVIEEEPKKVEETKTAVSFGDAINDQVVEKQQEGQQDIVEEKNTISNNSNNDNNNETIDGTQSFNDEGYGG